MANDFSNDSSVVGHWKFNFNLNDSKGSNDLTAHGSNSKAIEYTSIAIEGGGAMRLSDIFPEPAGQRISAIISDAALSPGFPGKNGAGTPAFSISFAWKNNPNSRTQPFALMRVGKVNSYEISLTLSGVDHNMTISAHVWNVATGTAVTVGTQTILRDWDDETVWVRPTLSYDTDQAYRFRVANASTGALLFADTVGIGPVPQTSASNFNVGSNPRFATTILRGAGTPPNPIPSPYLHELFDDLVVFNRAITEEEMTLVGNGTYSGSAPGDPSAPPDDLATFPIARPADYDPNLYWQPVTWEWGEVPVATGGGRWGQQLVAMGNGKVYYEALT